jgi:hypothetical protein
MEIIFFTKQDEGDQEDEIGGHVESMRWEIFLFSQFIIHIC